MEFFSKYILSNHKEIAVNFLNSFKNKKSLALFVIGNTETAKIKGISAAGENPNITDYTPAADMEYLQFGKCICIDGVPITPDGIPTPAIITKAALSLSHIPYFVVNSGTNVQPQLPFIHLGDYGGKNISKEIAVGNAEQIYEKAKIFGKMISTTTDNLIIGESIAGGTTTALSVLLSLGYDAYGKVSSSLKKNPLELKKEIIEEGFSSKKIQKGNFKENPIGAIKNMGDPIQAAILGICVGVNSKIPILLAGGTQMVAITALIKAKNPALLEKIAIGTTKWIFEDKTSDICGLMNEIDSNFPIIAINFDFSKMEHIGLQAYETGIVKEGVGAGGITLASLLTCNEKITLENIYEEILKNYNELIK